MAELHEAVHTSYFHRHSQVSLAVMKSLRWRTCKEKRLMASRQFWRCEGMVIASVCLWQSLVTDGVTRMEGARAVQAGDGFRQVPGSLRTSILVAMAPLYRSGFISSEGKAPKT